MADKYWALVDLRYPDGEDEYVKATTKKKDGTWPVAGKDYREVSVKAGDPMTGVSEKSIKACLAMGRDVISTTPPRPVVKAEKAKAVKA